jgi:hypothetical protein
VRYIVIGEYVDRVPVPLEARKRNSGLFVRGDVYQRGHLTELPAHELLHNARRRGVRLRGPQRLDLQLVYPEMQCSSRSGSSSVTAVPNLELVKTKTP